jgi:hypothetical protein
VKKPEDITSEAGYDRAKNTHDSVELPAVEARVNSWTQAWVKVRSWFEIPYGYEDKTGFHYGHEPVPVQASAAHSTFGEVFTDRACDSAMFMAATSTETSPAPAPEQPANAQRENRELTINPS